MAFLAAHLRRRRGVYRPRTFKQRKTLRNVDVIDVNNYRLPRDEIEELVRGFSDSVWANVTRRSHALSAETQVSQLS